MSSYNQQLAFLKLDDDAIIPLRATADSVGYDLSSKNNSASQIVPAQGKALFKLGLRVFIPQNCYGRIAPRSSLSWDKHTTISAGVIDPGYKGELGVVLFNHSDTDLEILPGQRIAQLILERCETPPVHLAEVDSQTGCFVFEMVDDINSVRGEGGFGSTGRLVIVDEQGSSNKKRSSPPSSPEEGEIYEEKEDEEGEEDMIIIDDTGDIDDDEFRISEEEKENAEITNPEKNHHHHHHHHNFSTPRPHRVSRHRHYNRNYKMNNRWNNKFRRAANRNRRMRNFYYRN
uniref:dUTP diphosphatase n=1 Tax=Metopaulias depressus WSSV-like virus TaxID=1675544 RepID=A0A0K0VL18_9VIRU|nr:dUTPase protein [Metopaulias depressus WSSV-like virus]